METLQLSVLDLPPVNTLELLPRFGISGKDADAIAQFAQTIGEIRLDQVEAQPAGNGKSAKQLQPNLPITIKPVVTDAIAPKVEYDDQFQVGDRVLDVCLRSSFDRKRGIGTVTKVEEKFIHIQWENIPHPTIHGLWMIRQDKWLKKLDSVRIFLENPSNVDSFPEISTKPKTHGYVEHYSVIGKNEREYYYRRYVYQDISGKLRHHHIPNKQTEAIAAMWQIGASAKEICTALSKECKSK